MKDPVRRTALVSSLLMGIGVLVVGIIPDLLFDELAQLVAVHAAAGLAAVVTGYLLIGRLLETRERARTTAATLESDLRSRERLLAENLQQKRLLQTILEADPDGMAVVSGPDLVYQLVNSAYRALTPHPESDPAGRPYEEVWRDAHCITGGAAIRRVEETGEPLDEAAKECRYASASPRFLGTHLRRLQWDAQPAVLIVLQDESAAESARQRANQASVEAQRKGEELAIIFEAMVEGIIVFDTEGTPIRANQCAAALLGPALGRPDRVRMTNELRMRRVSGEPLAHDELPSYRALHGETVKLDRFVLSGPDGRELTIQSSASPILIDGKISGAVAVWHDVTDLVHAEQQLRELAVLEERQHLSRELHDSVSQALYGIALGSNTALSLVDTDRDGTIEALQYVVSLTQLALTEMRAVIFELRPEALEKEGLVAGLIRQTAAIRTRHPLALQEDLGAEPDAPIEVKKALYWVAQEALNNAVKHARASEIGVRLADCGGWLELEISDNGTGFDPSQAFPGHLGLQSMRERVAQRGGSLKLDSAPGQGTRVVAVIPR